MESTSNTEWVDVPEWDTEEWEEYAEVYRRVELRQNSSLLEESNRLNIEEWLEAMDWSKIHTLYLSDVSPKVLQLLSGQVLPSLKQLCFTGGQSREIAIAHEDFINNTILPLQSINFQGVSYLNPDGLTDIITARHGAALTHLKLTGTVSKMEERHISRLHTLAPNINVLDIDMTRPPVG